MSDQEPIGPPPAYPTPSAPPCPDAAMPPSPAPAVPPYPSPAPAPPKRTTALVIAIVVGVLVLCCCIGGTGMALFLYAGDDATTSSTSGSAEEATGRISDATPGDDAARLQEWLDWQQSAEPTLEAAPTSFNHNITEAMSIVAPGFDVEETAWLPAEYDEVENWYYADAVYVRGVLGSSSKVSAAVELWIQSDDMITNGIEFEVDDGDILTTIADGNRQLLYVPQWGPAGFQLSTDEELGLWDQIGSDWPDAVVTDGTERGDQFVVTITKWEAYAVDGDYPVVSVTYEDNDGRWTLVNWRYESSNEQDTSST